MCRQKLGKSKGQISKKGLQNQKVSMQCDYVATHASMDSKTAATASTTESKSGETGKKLALKSPQAFLDSKPRVRSKHFCRLKPFSHAFGI